MTISAKTKKWALIGAGAVAAYWLYKKYVATPAATPATAAKSYAPVYNNFYAKKKSFAPQPLDTNSKDNQGKMSFSGIPFKQAGGGGFKGAGGGGFKGAGGGGFKGLDGLKGLH